MRPRKPNESLFLPPGGFFSSPDSPLDRGERREFFRFPIEFPVLARRPGKLSIVVIANCLAAREDTIRFGG